jgi:hypothetical protein
LEDDILARVRVFEEFDPAFQYDVEPFGKVPLEVDIVFPVIFFFVEEAADFPQGGL